MEIALKERLIKSVKAIKNKVKRIQNEEDQTQLQMNKVLKPITDPLNVMLDYRNKKSNNFINSKDLNMSSNAGENKVITDLENSDKIEDERIEDEDFEIVDDTKKSVVHKLNSPIRSVSEENDFFECQSESINVPFGIRTVNNNLMIGNTPIKLSNIESAADSLCLISVGNRQYELTKGLKELLFEKLPDFKLISDRDKITYKDILEYTNAHKRDFSRRGQIKGDRSIKYSKIVKPLFCLDETETKIGRGLPKLKDNKTFSDFIYWDNPNELIERLKLLIASKEAGNNNHNNEIISIIEELREAGIIK